MSYGDDLDSIDDESVENTDAESSPSIPDLQEDSHEADDTYDDTYVTPTSTSRLSQIVSLPNFSGLVGNETRANAEAKIEAAIQANAAKAQQVSSLSGPSASLPLVDNTDDESKNLKKIFNTIIYREDN